MTSGLSNDQLPDRILQTGDWSERQPRGNTPLRMLVNFTLGRGGYASYAAAVCRRAGNFHRSLANFNSNPNRIVEMNCSLWLLARTYGTDPKTLIFKELPHVSPMFRPTQVQVAFEDLLGDAAYKVVGARVIRTEEGIKRACENPLSASYLDLSMSAITLLHLRDRYGITPDEALDHVVDLTDDTFPLYRRSAIQPSQRKKLL